MTFTNYLFSRRKRWERIVSWSIQHYWNISLARMGTESWPSSSFSCRHFMVIVFSLMLARHFEFLLLCFTFFYFFTFLLFFAVFTFFFTFCYFFSLEHFSLCSLFYNLLLHALCKILYLSYIIYLCYINSFFFFNLRKHCNGNW